MLVLRYMFNKENKRRDAEEHDSTYDNVFVEENLDDGTVEMKKVDKVGTSFPSKSNNVLIVIEGFLGSD